MLESRQAETSSRPTARAVSRSISERPEPSASRSPAIGMPRFFSTWRTTCMPAAVVPAPRRTLPSCFTSISA